jgi:arylsulfatase A-like enzyme
VKGRGRDADEDNYLASVVGMDRALGRLFDTLETMGEAKNTLILLTSDNGPSPLKRYMKDGATPPGSAGALRGRKFSLYEGGVRQPLILTWPAGGKAGIRDERTVGGGVDILPTLAGVLKLPVPAGTRGTDLSPVLRGKPVTQRPPLFWSYGREGRSAAPNLSPNPRDVSPRFAVRDGDWKLLMNAGNIDQQLYNLKTDPNETRDVSKTEPAVRERLFAKLRGWMDGLAK